MATTDDLLDALAGGPGTTPDDYLPPVPFPDPGEYTGPKPSGLFALFGKNSILGELPNTKPDTFEEPFGSVGAYTEEAPATGAGGVTVTGGSFTKPIGNLTGPSFGAIQQEGGGGGRQQTAAFSTGSIGNLNGSIGSLGNSFGFSQG